MYDVTLTGGGRLGSDVQFVRAVPEGWLRSEGRIATAKSCAPVLFGAFALSAARLVVPLFQRRYCWEESHWSRLWRDVASPSSSLAPHALGRVVVARKDGPGSSGAVVLVDGQQRCTTLCLLLCAVRDVARADLPAKHADPLVSSVDRVLFTRRRKLVHPAAAAPGRRHGDDTAGRDGSEGVPASLGESAQGSSTPGPSRHPSATEQASRGLESLTGSAEVRLVPSRQDRLPFCSLVLRASFDEEGSRAARTMSECYECFKVRDLDEVPPDLKGGGRGGGGHHCICVSMYYFMYTIRRSTLHIYIYIYIHTYVYIYIYIYREREREIDICIYTHTHTSIYIYLYIHIYISG